jgi:hypothetical protein
MQTQIMETALTQEFVDPLLCKELHYAGLSDQTPYYWHHSIFDIRLATVFFDPDSYYRQAFINRQALPGVQKIIIIPAYRATELDRIIPAYALSKEKGCYIAMLDTTYGNAESKAQRLPDALARLTIQMLKQRILNIDYANQQFIINKLPDR